MGQNKQNFFFQNEYQSIGAKNTAITDSYFVWVHREISLMKYLDRKQKK